MILAILFAYFGYKKAAGSGRNGILWAIIAVAAFIGAQLVSGLLIGFILGLIYGSAALLEQKIAENELLINLIGILFGLIAGFLVIWYLGRASIIEDVDEPPPPPEF